MLAAYFSKRDLRPLGKAGLRSLLLAAGGLLVLLLSGCIPFVPFI